MIKVNGVEIQQNHFPAGELLIKANFNGAELMTIDWYYENDAELFTLICIKRHIDENYPGCFCQLKMPYTCHARMDRVKNPEDVFTLKYFCEVINSLNFFEVVIDDPHSEVCVALLNNVRVHTPEKNVKKVINMINDDSLVMFYPDKGAMKRYDGMLDLDYAYGEKKRNWETGRIEGLEIIGAENVMGNAVLIVDDICSYGGTFARAAQELRKAGAAAVYLYVTHCEDNIHKGDIFKDGIIDCVYTTNSIYTGKNDNTGGVVVL